MASRTTTFEEFSQASAHNAWQAVQRAIGWDDEKKTFGMCGIKGILGFHAGSEVTALSSALELTATWASGGQTPARLVQWDPAAHQCVLEVGGRSFTIRIHSTDDGGSRIEVIAQLEIGLKNALVAVLPINWIARDMAEQIAKHIS